MPLRRFALILAIVAALLVLFPYAIAPLYRFVDPVSMPMLWRYATGARVDRIVVPLSNVSPALRLAVIVAEDGSFCRNPGIDLGEMREALVKSDDNLDAARGASTITQQTAKNLFLWQGRSLIRKALEIPLAVDDPGVAEAANPGNLSQYRRMGPDRRIRRRGRRTLCIRQIGARSKSVSGSGTCRDLAESGAAQRPGAKRARSQARRSL